MADQDTQTAVQTQPQVSEPGESNVTGPTPEIKVTFTPEQQAAVNKMIADRLKRKEEADEKKAADEKAKAEEAKLKEQNEWKLLAEKHQAELEKTKAELAARDLAEKKRTIAAKYNIPDQLATRLVGSTDEEIEADAKALAETLPKAEQKKASPGPTHPGEGAEITKTAFERGKDLKDAGYSTSWLGGNRQ